MNESNLFFVFRDILGRKSNIYPKIKRKVMILKCEREMFLLTSVKITPFVRQVNKTFCTWPLIHRTQQASVTAKLWEFVVTIFDLCSCVTGWGVSEARRCQWLDLPREAGGHRGRTRTLCHVSLIFSLLIHSLYSVISHKVQLVRLWTIKCIQFISW